MMITKEEFLSTISKFEKREDFELELGYRLYPNGTHYWVPLNGDFFYSYHLQEGWVYFYNGVEGQAPSLSEAKFNQNQAYKAWCHQREKEQLRNYYAAVS